MNEYLKEIEKQFDSAKIDMPGKEDWNNAIEQSKHICIGRVKGAIQDLQKQLPNKIDIEENGTPEERELMREIFGEDKLAQYIKERRYGFNQAINQVQDIFNKYLGE